jgi:1D-myo-inositol 3-kinase
MSTSTHGRATREPPGEAHPQKNPAERRHAFDYVTVGHVTVDVLPDGSRRPGGTAFYSALQAARLGMRALILTRGVPAEIEGLLAPYLGELDLEVLAAEHTTTLRTRGEGSARRQRLLAWAGPIEGPIEVDTGILHLAPVARETPRAWRGRADFVGLTPQGLLRQWDAQGDITPLPLDHEPPAGRCDALVLSEHERESCRELVRDSPADGTVVAITAGAHPTAVHLSDGEILHVPVPAIEAPRDDLGAGDVFAAAFFIALREGEPPAAAAAFANAAAAVRIGGVGPGAIGDRSAIEAQPGVTGGTGEAGR